MARTGTVRKQFYDTGWERTSNLLASNSIQYRKINDVVEVFCSNENITGLTVNSMNKWGTLPNGFRPSYMQLFRTYGDNGYIEIATNGDIYIIPTTASSYFQLNWRFAV